MKPTLLFSSLLILFACNHSAEQNNSMQQRIDSLQTKLTTAYKPGFGEFMSSIQTHHAKLWWAGQHKNWQLADFEMHEIMEATTAIQQYETDRKESKSIPMLQPALDSVNNAIQQKNTVLFNSSYTLLTNTCNACHQANNFAFNKVKIPSVNTFSNQDFEIK